jgi:hypothetical protein
MSIFGSETSRCQVSPAVTREFLLVCQADTFRVKRLAVPGAVGCQQVAVSGGTGGMGRLAGRVRKRLIAGPARDYPHFLWISLGVVTGYWR